MFKEKRDIREWNGTKSCDKGDKQLNPGLKDINRLKKSLINSGIKGVVTSGQDPTPLNFQHLNRN